MTKRIGNVVGQWSIGRQVQNVKRIMANDECKVYQSSLSVQHVFLRTCIYVTGFFHDFEKTLGAKARVKFPKIDQDFSNGIPNFQKN